jgi:MFS family permease
MSYSQSPIDAPVSLWRNHSFLRLWFAQVVSNAGSNITKLALPLIAVLSLGATPAQMGLLAAAGSLPNLIFSLFAGVWVDRTRRRPVLIWADLGRALLLGSIPVATALGRLTLTQLYLIAFASGTLGVFFIVASTAVLPSVVSREQLVEANSKLALGDSVLAIAGPSAAGGLIQLLSAPKAIIVDAFSYALSALSLRGVRVVEQPPSRTQRRSIWVEIAEGMRELMRTPLLRALMISGLAGTLGLSAQGAVWMLFLVRQLGLNPAVIGLIAATGGGASLVGALLASRIARLAGTGRAVVAGQGLWAIGALVPAAAGLGGPAIAPLIIGQITTGIGATIWSVNQMSLRQHLTDLSLLGRVTAARRFLILGAAPLGATLGGLLGSVLGLRMTLLVGAIGPILALLLVICSPVRDIRDLPGGGASR